MWSIFITGSYFVQKKNVLKKVYFLFESLLLKAYEKKAAAKASIVLTVSKTDLSYFKTYCPAAVMEYLPLFLPFENVAIKKGTGNFYLYQGNLEIAENEQVAIWLIEKVFNEPLSLPLIIAGRLPSTRLQKLVKKK